ncbi:MULTISPECIES: PocR ligand-binding domain-containing protein [Cetobacterium]|jgi:ligand-binding sensor protein/AraC-like DNA-binding protein|uniref:PocR ligand-binding domain-containing protein n=1 Tax=Candidatus Cetobacterium colombiensis TaxID=3073100 RepID=A0ABU4W6J4_9FUSO|nr:PocR ligand-binding domain-containing protein [Candidatus Cetobacterium colombiensis]MDX8335147.1 PocR ligand-binding domain-containing protein [Candidatus Cetobacterium colombiensis]
MLHKYKKELIKIQEDIVNMTKMAVVIVDDEGNYLTEKSNYSEFCKIFRKNKELNSFCEKCDVKALSKAFLSLKPYIYRCHAGLVDMIIPIIYQGELIGAFLVGQILLEDEETFDLDNILVENIGKEFSIRKIAENYNFLKKVKYSELQSIASILHYTSVYITNCIKNKVWYNHKIENNIKQERVEYSHSQISSAITHINENVRDNLHLEEVSNLCNLSVSQFSRVFKRETGKTFKEYVLMKKIEKAKYFLEITNKSLSEISNEIGIDDSSYFTKVFKKYEKMCPKEYREIFQK